MYQRIYYLVISSLTLVLLLFLFFVIYGQGGRTDGAHFLPSNPVFRIPAVICLLICLQLGFAFMHIWDDTELKITPYISMAAVAFFSVIICAKLYPHAWWLDSIVSIVSLAISIASMKLLHYFEDKKAVTVNLFWKIIDGVAKLDC